MTDSVQKEVSSSRGRYFPAQRHFLDRSSRDQSYRHPHSVHRCSKDSKLSDATHSSRVFFCSVPITIMSFLIARGFSSTPPPLCVLIIIRCGLVLCGRRPSNCCFSLITTFLICSPPPATLLTDFCSFARHLQFLSPSSSPNLVTLVIRDPKVLVLFFFHF